MYHNLGKSALHLPSPSPPKLHMWYKWDPETSGAAKQCLVSGVWNQGRASYQASSSIPQIPIKLAEFPAHCWPVLQKLEREQQALTLGLVSQRQDYWLKKAWRYVMGSLPKAIWDSYKTSNQDLEMWERTWGTKWKCGTQEWDSSGFPGKARQTAWLTQWRVTRVQVERSCSSCQAPKLVPDPATGGAITPPGWSPLSQASLCTGMTFKLLFLA